MPDGLVWALALSTRFAVTTVRGGRTWAIAFEDGVKVSGFTEYTFQSESRGSPFLQVGEEAALRNKIDQDVVAFCLRCKSLFGSVGLHKAPPFRAGLLTFEVTAR